MHLIGLELALPGAFGQIPRGGGNLAQAKIRHIAENGDEQAGVRVHGYADVDFAMDDDLVIDPACIQVRMFAERGGGEFGEEISVSWHNVAGRLELLAQIDEVRSVGAGGQCHGHNGSGSSLKALSDGAAEGGGRAGVRGTLSRGADVALTDPSSPPAALKLRPFDT